MRRTIQPFVTAAGFALLASIAVTAPALAQDANGSAGTGGAAGHAPPMDEPYGGAAPMNVPPPMDDAMGAPAPEPMNSPPTEEEKKDESTPAPTDAAKDQ
jgi:hypothetical protein